MKKLLIILAIGISLFGNQFDNQLKKSMNTISKNLPLVINPSTTFTKIELIEKRLTYFFSLKTEQKSFTEIQKNEIIKSSCENATTKLILSNGYTYVIDYTNSNKENIETIELNAKKCGYTK